MAMVVQHNLTAMNSNRQLGVTTSSQAKSSEKLSSGYRINRAGDDAAGLKISEKMRSQVRGLNRASTNAQDGVSLIQTAEGALNEAHSILQRMNELAVQGANDTNENIDREAINEELNQLTQELDRISTTTQFNKQNLLDGTFQQKNLHVGANANQKIQISIDNMNAETLGLRSIKGYESGEVPQGEKPSSVTYKGMTYQWDASKTVSANQNAAKEAFSTAIKNAAKEDQYAPQISGASVFYLKTGDSTTKQISIHFFSYYKKWDPEANYEYCKENTRFICNPERSEGTFSSYASLDDKLDGFHYYLSYIKFGIGRATADTAHEIRDGRLSKEEGIHLIEQYDGEFPKKYLNEMLDYCDITKKQLDEFVDSWRSEHLWEKVNGEWRLKNPIWNN